MLGGEGGGQQMGLIATAGVRCCVAQPLRRWGPVRGSLGRLMWVATYTHVCGLERCAQHDAVMKQPPTARQQ